MAFEAGSRGKVDGVAITAGCLFMVDTVIFTTAGRMRQVECGRTPGSGVVALIAFHTREQASME
ncbi:MAG: hypothetical protein A2029_06355 [Chloroflexi bacterium RBG_19FT_COMBO_47_9]|nr:MAG: hypothetical protein A2029_06355 [Chloroflexi bacterium RBG_19FT_COMBO_47_9]